MPLLGQTTSRVKTNSNAPRQDSAWALDLPGRESALNTLYIGTLSVALVAFLVVSGNYLFLHMHQLAPRIALIGFALGVIVALYIARRRSYALASYGLLAFYLTAATVAALLWGIENPIGVLLFALVIIFSGILLGARYSLYTLSLSLVIMAVIVALAMQGIIRPNTNWTTSYAGFYDVAIFAVILGNLTLVSWFFNRSMEKSLQRALRSEQALRRQKQLLEVKVEERTRQVQAAHVERLQELYRFAELGHMSVALLHDLANYLAVLSLDIEDLKQARQNRSVVAQRVQNSIRHLDSLISQVRNQIKGEITVKRFNVADELNQVMHLLAYKASAQHVIMAWEQRPRHRDLFYTGSVSHFWQVTSNVLSNAIDAYAGHSGSKHKKVIVSAIAFEGRIMIQITDFGAGIPATEQAKIFEPFYSTKKESMGIGLAIAKRMVEKDFGGTITLASKPGQGTTFTITLPQDSHAGK